MYWPCHWYYLHYHLCTNVGIFDNVMYFVKYSHLLNSGGYPLYRSSPVPWIEWYLFQDHLEVLNQEGTCRSSVLPGRCLRERNTPAMTPSKIPSKMLLPRMQKTPQPQETPIKPPRKNIAGQKPSSKLPGSILRTARGTSNSPAYLRGTATTPRLTTPRGKLPIIIWHGCSTCMWCNCLAYISVQLFKISFSRDVS